MNCTPIRILSIDSIQPRMVVKTLQIKPLILHRHHLSKIVRDMHTIKISILEDSQRIRRRNDNNLMVHMKTYLLHLTK